MARTRRRNRAAAITALVFLSTAVVAQSLRLAPLAQGEARVTFEQAAPVLQALLSNLPSALRGRSAQEIARLWPSWVERHDRDVRARVERGDEDSLVNFWLYGTSFTSQPPAVPRASPLSAAALDMIIKDRLEDLLDRVTRPRRQRAPAVRPPHACGAQRRRNPTDAPGRERARHCCSIPGSG